MINLYFYHIETHAKKPVFEEQNWEYTKKFYHTLYKRIEDDISDEVLSQLYSMAMMEKSQHGDLIGVIPYLGIHEFFERLKASEYNPDDIYNVWERIPQELRDNNVKCGVCPEGYSNRPFHGVAGV